MDTVWLKNEDTGTIWEVPASEADSFRARGLVDTERDAPALTVDPEDDATRDRELRDGASETHDPAYTEAVQAHSAPTVDEALLADVAAGTARDLDTAIRVDSGQESPEAARADTDPLGDQIARAPSPTTPSDPEPARTDPLVSPAPRDPEHVTYPHEDSTDGQSSPDANPDAPAPSGRRSKRSK